MDIQFSMIGLDFKAEVEFFPGVPGRTWGPPEDCYPDEGAEVDILSLSVNDADATFLLDSDLQVQIEELAMEAAIKAYCSALEDHKIDAYIDQMEYT